MGGEKKFQISMEAEPEFSEVVYNQEKEVLVLGGLKAPEYEEDLEDKRAAVDLVCVVDKSGSMAGAKIKLMKEALKFVVDQMDVRDNLSIVEYDTNVNTPLKLTKMDKDGKSKAQHIVSKIIHGSATNLSGGLLQGIDIALKKTTKNDVTSVLLFTDGLANNGITKSDQIVAAIESCLEKFSSKRCTIYTFGFGSDHDDEMLRNVAQAGQGVYYFIEGPDKIPVAFADALGGLQSVVGQNMKLTIEAQNGAKIKECMNSHLKKEESSDTKFVINVGDIFSDEEKNILFLTQLPIEKEPVEKKEYFKITFDYFNVIHSSLDSTEEICCISRTEKEPENQKVNNKVDQQRNRYQAIQTMEESKKLANEGKFTASRKLLQDRLEFVKTSASANDEYCVNLQSEMMDMQDLMESEEVYSKRGKKEMNRKMMSHQYERGNDLELESKFYKSNAKMKKKGGFFN